MRKICNSEKRFAYKLFRFIICMNADALEPTLRAAMDVDGPAVVAIPVDYSDNPLLMGQLHLSQIL